MKPTSSFGSERARRAQKAQQDVETQHRLWYVRLTTIMNEKSCTPQVALDALSKEIVAQRLNHPPQVRQQLFLTWHSFLKLTK